MKNEFTASSIDGDVTLNYHELVVEQSTDWSDETCVPVFSDDGDEVGAINPETGEFTSDVLYVPSSPSDVLVLDGQCAWVANRILLEAALEDLGFNVSHKDDAATYYSDSETNTYSDLCSEVASEGGEGSHLEIVDTDTLAKIMPTLTYDPSTQLWALDHDAA